MYPPPLVLATLKFQINTVPTPTVAWTRPWLAHDTYNYQHGELMQEMGISCTNIPKIRLCGFKWANTHKK